jgi:hypothetical protein
VGISRAWIALLYTFFALCWTGVVFAQDETPPSTPGNFAANAVSGSRIDLTWNASTDNPGGGVTGYNITRCLGASCTYILTAFANQTSFANTGLASGATYTYYINAFDAAGNLSEDASATATTFDVLPPTTPTNLAANPAAGAQINLTWTASTDGGGVSGYQVERCTGGSCSNFAFVGSTASASYSSTGLASATTYSFRVRAYDGVPNYSNYSATVSATSLDVTPPIGPAQLTATPASSGTQIDLNWPTATDNVQVIGYLVQRCAGVGCSNFVQIADTNLTAYSATGLASSTPYTFRVRAYDAVPNYGNFSPLASATTLDVSPPSAPASLTATPMSTTQIDLGWPAASDNVGVAGYEIERCSGASCSNFTFIASTAALSYSSTGLTPGTSYSFRVRAYDGVPTYGGYSPTSSASTQGTPAPPSETITYTYDALGRLENVSRSGTVNNGEQATYTYDAAGNRTNVTVVAAP